MSARLVLAAPESGSGKTTFCAGLVAALVQRGLRVQPFKCGPDYIDPGYLSLAAGRPCRNVDSWLLGAQTTRQVFAAASADSDLALIEGVMGLFDGYGALDEAGSTAHVARLLDAPVVLVVDARGMARSIAALVDGFRRFDPRVRLAGVLLNRVGSARHAELCATAIQTYTGLPCLGYLPRDAALALPERHLGLIPSGEHAAAREVIARVAATLATTCDLERLVALAQAAPPLPAEPPVVLPRLRSACRPRIAVAQDAAFSFIYPETIELLEAAGAEVVPFSPMRDPGLPPDTAGVILSGGFPELYAAELSANSTLHAALRAAHTAGMPIYAECGGLMLLTEALVDQAGRRWPMVGLLPGTSAMTPRLRLGYRSVRALRDGPLLPAGAVVRGHEFHYSRWEAPVALPAAYAVLDPTGQAVAEEGAQQHALMASYVHLHWLTRPEIAARFVAWCVAWQGAEHG
ncbi:cobyrinate a,c-diamide synthase [Kallotenue papyrolyticum]|uniref:cobyrinate a,c-diamide synthase n=1 Tax=Kallotenue papyrolyticum TaxID=1325125 RepID=UPI00047856B8|nr:cobyrinate a,c-diamide synthase [Kallotenue papyrolyticum]